jgi:hypothetical protein
MTRVVLSLMVFLGSLAMAIAADRAMLYEPATLQYWGARYQRSTTKILTDIIWPALLSEEKRRFVRQPALDFPLYAEGKARQHPLAFYVPADLSRVVMPVFSLKFLDDLCTAYAWLQVKGYSLETVSEYTAILKYGPASGSLPPPLQALGIPADALKVSEVDELALGHFVTARLFILLHEMGHILHGHAARTSAESVRNEQQADQFAINVIKRTPLPPLGMLIFFLADAHWSDFPASGTDTHPVSGARVSAMARAVDDPQLAQQLRDFGALLDDSDIRAGFVATGKAGDFAALAPRRRGELPRRQMTSQPAGQSGLFNGVYRGEFVQLLDPRPIAVELALERRGDEVRGRYSFGLGLGTLRGQVVGDQLHFDWGWAGNYGRGVLTGRSDGSFAGTWGYREAASGAGRWTGRPHP